MILNVNEFKHYLKKATLNFSIDSVHINIKRDTLSSIMTSPDFSSIVVLNLDNNVFSSVSENEEYDLYFQEPNRQIVPFLNLIDEDEVTFTIKENKGKVEITSGGNQKSSLFLCSPEVVSVFNRSRPREELDSVFTINMAEIEEYLKKIKKIGTRFGKVYFGSENKKFFMETTDRESGRFTNSLRFDIVSSNVDDFVTCFRFRGVMNVYSVLDELSNYVFSLSLKEQNDATFGLIEVARNDGKENYFLMSIIENV